MLILDPNAFLPTLLGGAEKSALTCFALLSSYAVWLGLMRVWEDSGVARGISRFLKPIARKLLRTEDEKTLNAACMNLSVNLLGISGAATPYGIQTAKLLDKTPNAEYASAMFFVLNATSLQLFPSSMIAVRVSMHSTAPYDIILPTLITTLFSTFLGVVLTKIFVSPNTAMLKTKKSSVPKRKNIASFFKTRGAGT